MYAIKVYGESCSYWLGADLSAALGVSRVKLFDSEDMARVVATGLYHLGRIGFWEVKCA